jgi:two-component system LytT family sensor kinase
MELMLFFRDLKEMKRFSLHLVFWVIYVMQDTLVGIVWSGSDGLVGSGPVWKALLDALLCLVSKLLFTYFVLEVSVPRIVSEKVPIARVVGEMVFVFLFSIFVYRLIAINVIFPVVYGKRSPTGLLSLRGFISAMMDIGFVAGVATVLKLVGIQMKVRENEKLLIREKLEAELKFLRQQTSPHFLLNTLNNVYALARKKSEDTAEVVMKLSELLRFILYESSDPAIPLIEEIKVLEDYLGLERMRYDRRLTVRLKKELDAECYKIAPLLLLPFVENAFKHGISESRFESYVYIDIRVEKGRLEYTVENSKDDGVRMSSNKNIGLANVRRRLELTYKDYNLDILQEPSSYRVNLSLNLESRVEI